MPDVAVVRSTQPYTAGPTVEQNRASALQLIYQLLRLTDVNDKHLNEQLSIGLWKWTEAEGVAPYAKYNTRYISAGVKNAVGPALINHEHVWTRKDLTTQLRAKTWDLAELEKFLTTYGAACIVTVAEHGQLSTSKKTGWSRYADRAIGVWDRQVGDWVDPADLMPAGGVAPAEPEPSYDAEPVEPSVPAVAELVRANAKPVVAERLMGFLRIVRWQQAVAVPSFKKTGEVSEYFRVYDALVEEPTRVVAYVHWTGKIDFGLQATDLPENPAVGVLADPTYGVRSSLGLPGALDLAGDLLALALEKVRSEV
ncbi:hypothetical protein [Kribbella sp. NPDC051770]|uniref:hypothetical protein n=1 Tax=Kribbella sp. NPDC051770 TaxID=3155413 RepID=UPI00342B5708